MSEILSALVDARSDAKALIKALQDLNQNFKTFQQGIKVMDEFTKMMRRNEKTFAALVKEMHEMNENISNLLKVAKELK